MKPARRLILLCLLAATAAGCDGQQSWADPAGEDADIVARLMWVLLAGAAVIWAAVLGLAIYATRAEPLPRDHPLPKHLVTWGGIALPTLTVLILTVAGLLILREITERDAELTVQAKGEQFWWRIAHQGPGGQPVPTPNELRLPAGRTAEILLTADRVIHAFWVPSLGGKMDMIPGALNRMTLTPTKPGVYRGQCAEFCGEAHAQMAFQAVVMEPAAFADWLAGQAAPAAEPDTEAERQGQALFLATGCGGCHAIRGTEAIGRVGPDLTHVGSRLSIGAGILPVTVDAMARWIADTRHLKPGVRMPEFGMLPPEEVRLIAEYLVGLE